MADSNNFGNLNDDNIKEKADEVSEKVDRVVQEAEKSQPQSDFPNNNSSNTGNGQQYQNSQQNYSNPNPNPQQSYYNQGNGNYAAPNQPQYNQYDSFHYQQPPYPPQNIQKSRIAAGLLGYFLGGFGAHNFYMGYTARGIIQIVITVVTCGIGAIWGFIESLMIFSGSIATDADGVPLDPYGTQPRNKLAAGLLGIFLGGFGVHNLYMGYTTRAIIQIVVSIVTCGVGALWGFIEGILILAGSITLDSNGIPLE
jgi:TM2 domain-containing membrane protein YozV